MKEEILEWIMSPKEGYLDPIDDETKQYGLCNCGSGTDEYVECCCSKTQGYTEAP